MHAKLTNVVWWLAAIANSQTISPGARYPKLSSVASMLHFGRHPLNLSLATTLELSTLLEKKPLRKMSLEKSNIQLSLMRRGDKLRDGTRLVYHIHARLL